MGSLAGSCSDRTLPPMKMASFVPACPACIKVFGRAPWIEMSWRISALPCHSRRSPIACSLLWPKPTYRRTFSGGLSFSWLGHRKLNGSPIRERRVSAGHPSQKPLAEGPTGYSAVCVCVAFWVHFLPTATALDIVCESGRNLQASNLILHLLVHWKWSTICMFQTLSSGTGPKFHVLQVAYNSHLWPISSSQLWHSCVVALCKAMRALDLRPFVATIQAVGEKTSVQQSMRKMCA